MTRVYFRASANVKTIMGKELITNPNVAIFELVKNSFDAYASHAWIIFKDVESQNNARIVIVDDGDGMTEEDLKKKWLFAGFSEKREAEKGGASSKPASEGRHRIFAGQKGIGKFSCDSLGEKLVLHTKAKGTQTIHRLDIDWTRFEKDQHEEFQKIPADLTTEEATSVEGYNLAKMEKGTILEISGLRNTWDVTKLRTLKRYLQRLVTPLADDLSAEEFSIEVKAEEFREEDKKAKASPKMGPQINGPVKNFVFENLGLKTTFIHSWISGKTVTTRLTDKDNLVFQLKEKSPYKDLQDIDVRIFYLNKAAKSAFKKATGLAPKEYGSVFLYKNQFRVHPYGDPTDDWLGLQERKGQGYARFLSKREIIGTVLLKGQQPLLREVSSRDAGVIKNSVFYELTDYVAKRVVRMLERYVTGVIDWDNANVQGSEDRQGIEAKSVEMVSKLVERTVGPDTTIKVGPALLQTLDAKLTDKYPKILGNLETLREHVKDDKERALLDTTISSVRLKLASADTEKAEMASSLAAKEQQILFLKKAVTAETENLDNSIHTMKIYAGRINSRLIETQKRATSAQVPESITEDVGYCSLEARKIIKIANIALRAQFSMRDEEIEEDAVSYIKQYMQHFKPKFDELGPIQLFNDSATFVTVFKPASLAIVLDNLTENSRKNGAHTVSVKFEVSGKELHIFFGDDGQGVISDAPHHMFEMGFSTTGGTGLGLYHAKKLMEDLKGSIQFVGNNQHGLGSGACFEVILKN